MMLESLKVENLLGCNYEVEFDPRYTVIIGNNRQGKTLTARLIMLALYGTGAREKELHDSWKLRAEELLPTADKGSIELILERGGKRYKIYREFGKGSRVEFYAEKDGSWGGTLSRKDTEIATLLEEEVGITPGLMNVVMSNEQSLIGAISYDDKLQASVWEGWKWRTEIIRGNIKKARDKCAREGTNLRGELEELRESLLSIQGKWVERGVFSPGDVETGIDETILKNKLHLLDEKREQLEGKLAHCSNFFDALIKYDDLEDKAMIENLIDSFKSQQEFLDEREEIQELKTECESYLSLLSSVLEKGGKEGIRESIRNLEDEENKLKTARSIKERKKEPFKAECAIYPPEDGARLTVQIPDQIAARFKHEEISTGSIAVPYDEQKERNIAQEKRKLEELSQSFEIKKKDIKEAKDSLRDKIGIKKEKLGEEKVKLEGQKTILEGDKDRYLEVVAKIIDEEGLISKLDTAKDWFDKLYTSLSEEESLRKIRKETVGFINRIYEKVYNWDINAKLEDENKISITDSQGNVRSHPSGSETHIMGLAWRWMVARGFDLPLVLDELDVLLDEKNFDRTRRLIEEEMDRQTLILTLKEGLKDLPGRVYKIVRDENISTIREIS